MMELIVTFTDGSVVVYSGVLSCEIPAENDRVLMATLEGEGKPMVVIIPLNAIKHAAYGEADSEVEE